VSEADRDFCARAVASLKRALPLGDEPSITLSHRDSPVLTNLNNGLLVSYLVDQTDHFQYVQRRHLTAAGLTEAELHQRGIANLSTLFNQQGANVHQYGNIFVVVFGGNFEASLILVDELWNKALAHLAPNGFIAAVPFRDILAFCDAENASGVLKLRQLIQQVENGDHPISPVLYRRHASIWKPYAD
jgi:uncharacterized protein YtpQ (UPF0354 family)